MAFRTFADSAEATTYVESLDERWPQREEVKTHLSNQLGVGPARLRNVVEFCAGAGALASRILADFPSVYYTGIDASAVLLALAGSDLAVYAGRTDWIEADLNQDGWLAYLPERVDAFTSLQSLHDLGGADAVTRIAGLAAARLAQGGCFVYADLLPDPTPGSAPNPGRLPVDQHLRMLMEAGFTSAQCTLTLGPFGCFRATIG